MPDPWYVLEITGECRNRFWHGPFEDSEAGTAEEQAKTFAYSLYNASFRELPLWFINPHAINNEQRFFRRVWYGMGKIRYEGDKLYVFIGTGYEVLARDIDGNFSITDSRAEQTRVENDEETVEYCAGPMVDDWCEDCEGVQEVADGWTPTYYEQGVGGFEINTGTTLIPANSGSAPYLFSTLVSPLQSEAEAVVSNFGGDIENWVSADGTNTCFAAYGYSRVARITDDPGGFGVNYGYPNANTGQILYIPDSEVEGWLAAGCPVNIPVVSPAGENEWDVFAEVFDTPDVYFLGWDYKVELYAQIASGGIDFGTCYTARSNYDLDYYNKIEAFPTYPAYRILNSIDSGFIPAGEVLDAQGWKQPGRFVQLPVGFRHTNDLDGKVIGDMVAPWAIAVTVQITPRLVAANGINTCDIPLGQDIQAFTILARCPREEFQRPWPFPGLGTSTNPNFEPWPFTYGLFREEEGESDVPEPIYGQEFWGWSGNGIDFATLLVLNPAWAINAFIDNWPPFKRVPGYKKMVEFIRYITGKRSQYQSIGTDPVTGWEVYPVPVIVGADESGFPVYGPAVYKTVEIGGKNQ